MSTMLFRNATVTTVDACADFVDRPGVRSAMGVVAH